MASDRRNRLVRVRDGERVLGRRTSVGVWEVCGREGGSLRKRGGRRRGTPGRKEREAGSLPLPTPAVRNLLAGRQTVGDSPAGHVGELIKRKLPRVTDQHLPPLPPKKPAYQHPWTVPGAFTDRSLL